MTPDDISHGRGDGCAFDEDSSAVVDGSGDGYGDGSSGPQGNGGYGGGDDDDGIGCGGFGDRHLYPDEVKHIGDGKSFGGCCFLLNSSYELNG